MPRPFNVFGVNSRQSRFASCKMTLRTRGVMCGTTLHNTAPSNRALATNPATSALAFPWPQVALGIFACLITREAVANPRCVFVLPMSSNRIMCDNGVLELKTAGALTNQVHRSDWLARDHSDVLSRFSFFQRQISADDAFEMPV